MASSIMLDPLWRQADCLPYMPDGVRLVITMKKKMPKDIAEFFRREGAKGGRKGGKARMELLTPEQRKELAQKAAAARWRNKVT